MKTIVFIHGMFQNNKSWENWVNYFGQLGYECIAPSWPLHEGNPAALRANPPQGLGDLQLEEVVKKMEEIVRGLDEKPIVIGHSVGGLIVQILANKDLISLGVSVVPVAPARMSLYDKEFLKNISSITDPSKGNEPMLQDAKAFHTDFCNTLNEEDGTAAFEQTATHDSRNVLRDCMTRAGEVDMDRPHVPLLFIGAEEDKIIPCRLVAENTNAYSDPYSVADYKEFDNRSHYICGEPGWDEVTEFIAEWIGQQKDMLEDATEELSSQRRK